MNVKARVDKSIAEHVAQADFRSGQKNQKKK